MLSGLFSPRCEVPRPREKVVSLKRGYSRSGEKAPGASALSRVFSPRREIFCPSDEVFSPGESIFAKAKIDLALWTIFAQAINFSLGRGVFLPRRNWSSPS